jgi:hypothetical protein
MSHSIRPPRVAVWLLSLFVQGAGSDSILGDLSEEFFEVASKSGTTQARRWYWRQSRKTIVHIFGGAFREAPWSTLATLLGGMLLLRFVSGLPDRLLSAVTDKYLFYWSNHFKLYMFCATDGMLIAHFIASLLVGIILALAAKGREMVAATTLALMLGVMGLVGAFEVVAKTGDVSFLWIAAVQSFDSFAILVGAAIVRRRRSAATAQLLTT